MTKRTNSDHLTGTLLPALALTLAGAVSGCGGGDGGTADPGREPLCEDCPQEVGQIRVVDTSALACDALLEAVGGVVLALDVEGGAVGKMVKEGDRAGISVVARGTAALAPDAVSVRFTGELRLLNSTCYGASGEALPGPGLAL